MQYIQINPDDMTQYIRYKIPRILNFLYIVKGFKQNGNVRINSWVDFNKAIIYSFFLKSMIVCSKSKIKSNIYFRLYTVPYLEWLAEPTWDSQVSSLLTCWAWTNWPTPSVCCSCSRVLLQCLVPLLLVRLIFILVLFDIQRLVSNFDNQANSITCLGQNFLTQIIQYLYKVRGQWK